MIKEKKRLIIIDGNALVHRAYHALPPLSTKKGEIVNAVYGFLLVFLKTIKEFQPDFIAATFDLAAPTFRHEKFKDYKATRKKAPDELYSQLPKVKEILRNFNVPIFEKEGYEADDVIGTIAKLAQTPHQKFGGGPEIESIILSGDLDVLQLINKNTKVYALRKGLKDTVLYDEKAVAEKYEGLNPSQMIDLKALKGDPSDNVPGVPGIGDKTAIALLKEFKNLENLYKHVGDQKTSKIKKESINPRILALLNDYKDRVFFNKTLVDINKNVPIDFNLKMSTWGAYDREKVIKNLKELEFYSLIERLPEEKQKRKVSDQTLKLEEPVGILQQIENFYKEGMFSKKIYEIEKNLFPTIEEMEKNGVKIDLKALKELSDYLDKRLKKIESIIYELAEKEFNINSPQQLSEIIFQKLKISQKGVKKTPGGVLSTSSPELEKIKGEHKIIGLILEYRELFKLKSGFADALPGWVNKEDARIHPNFDQLGTVTGRLSCSNPNLQNIPVKGELGKEIRKCFVTEKGFKLLSADYSQMELRIAASIANDEKMIRFFEEGKDIHKITASKIFKVSEDKVTEEMRNVAKTLNFGVLYGMGAYGFAAAANVSRKEAKIFIKEYFKNFEGISKYVGEAIEKVRRESFVETMFGRKRFLPEIDSSDPRLQRAAERMAINHPIQGCLPWKTKILTLKGYRPIGELYELKEKKPKFIWNGSKWLRYTVLNRGKAKLAKIEFSNGQIFNCDTRHQVLTIKNDGYYWKSFSELKPGLKVCFSFPKTHNFQSPPPIKFNYKPKVHNSLPFSLNKIPSEFWYWIGYYYGDGHFGERWDKKKVRAYYLTYFFGFNEKKKVAQCIKFFKSLKLNPLKKTSIHKTEAGNFSKRFTVTIYSQGLGEFLEILGLKIGATAHTKRIFQRIFVETLENRRAFIQGLMDSDGWLGRSSKDLASLHMCQRELLQDFQVLLRTLGLESNLRGPYQYKNKSYRLNIPRQSLLLALKKIASRKVQYLNRPIPNFLKKEVLSLYPNLTPKFFKIPSDYIVYRRWVNGGSSSIYHFVQWLDRNNLKIKNQDFIYTWHTIKTVKRLKKEGITYTLSVEGDTHRFDSEGVISKNTAADVIKMAMIECQKIIEPQKDSAKMMLQIHDELLFEIKNDNLSELAEKIKKAMEGVAKLKAPLKIDLEIGENWGELKKLQK